MKFFSVVIRAQTYLNILYLLLSFPLGIFYFVVLVTGLAVGFGLIITLLGIPILALMLVVWMGLAFVERWIAIQFLHVKIAPLMVPLNGNLWNKYKILFFNPVTWKSLLFLFLKFPLGIFAFVVVVTLTSLSFALAATPVLVILSMSGAIPEPLMFGQIALSDYPLWSIPFSLFGLFLALLSFHAFNGIAFVNGRLAKLLLGSESNKKKR